MAKLKKVKGKAVSAPKRNWTLLAYIAGDNDLSDNGISDIKEMCDEGSDASMHISVQIDTEGEHDGIIRYEIDTPGFDHKSYRKVIERKPESDSGTAGCLTDYLKWGLTRYPAQKKIAVVWSHGSGFKAVTRDIGFDYDTDNSMDMPEVERAFIKAGIGPKNKLDILGFDACLMAMLEVAHHIKDYAHVLVGSQQTEPGNGWPYDKVLASLKSNPTTENMAKAIVKSYCEFYRKHGPSQVTQSAILLHKTSDAIAALHQLGDYFRNNLEGIKTRLNTCRIQAQNFDYTDYIDIIDFAELIKKELKGKNNNKHLNLCNQLIQASKDSIIASQHYGNTVNRSNGLSVWFPSSMRMYVENRSKYMQLNCNSSNAGWVKFLDAFFNS